MMIVTSSSSQGSFSKRFPSIITRNEQPAFSDLGLKSVLEKCYFSRLRDKLVETYYSDGTIGRLVVGCHGTFSDYLGIWWEIKVILG